MRKGLWILFVVLAVIIGLYPNIYFLLDRRFGLLGTKSNAVLVNNFWNIAFYAHIIPGGISLLIGWMQFSVKLRTNYLNLHRQIGKIYVIAVMLSAMAGFYIAIFATGGLLTSLGFISLDTIWFSTTLLAYTSIRKMQVARHQKMMIYSYAACFAAVTLRVWLPLLSMIFSNFITAYTIVSWLCWIPNVFVANLITKRLLPAKI